MKVNIWSDTRCPFCYIGKHNFEKALANFPHKDQVKVVWHSFQLDASLKTNLEMDHATYLHQAKGYPLEQIEQITNHLVNAAKEVGLVFNMEKAKVANSFKAQMLVQMAKENGKDNDMEEALFAAQFTHGINIDDIGELQKIGLSLGYTEDEIRKAVTTERYAYAISQDIQTANQIGVKGVPFFIFNDKYAASGAQPVAFFEEILQKSWEEYSAGDQGLNIISESDSCDINGENC